MIINLTPSIYFYCTLQKFCLKLQSKNSIFFLPEKFLTAYQPTVYPTPVWQPLVLQPPSECQLKLKAVKLTPPNPATTLSRDQKIGRNSYAQRKRERERERERESLCECLCKIEREIDILCPT